jgi:ribosome-binding protein aMBF1 (putative translation factor)
MTKVLSLKLTSEQLAQLLEMVNREECDLCGEKYEGWVGEMDDLRWKLARLNSCNDLQKAIKKIQQKYHNEQPKQEEEK